jgi:Zn-dependent protease with chaperone function
MASPNAEALTGVLGHEMAHAHHGHVRQRMLREIGLAVLMGTSRDQASGVFRQMVSLSYDRNMESEADRTAVDWLMEAKVDPTPLGNFLASMTDGGNMPLVTLARTHPGSEDRALKILDMIPADHPAWEPVLTAQQWQQFQDQVGKAVTTRD